MKSQVTSEVQSGSHDGRSRQSHDGRTLSHGVPAEPLLRVFPIKRWIPQDVHSIMDYVDGITAGSGYLMPENKRDKAACWASLALGASVIGVSLVTDYRLSIAKLVPIRVHETADYLWGASAIALPFVLGYWKSSPRTALTHVIVGAGSIIASMFTDYRSYKQEQQRRRQVGRQVGGSVGIDERTQPDADVDVSTVMPT